MAEEDGLENRPILGPVIARLEAWMEEVRSQPAAPTIPERAEQIGLASRIDTAIQMLRFCETNNIAPWNRVDVVPQLFNPCYQPEIRIVDDREGDDQLGWKELEFADGKCRRLWGGELILGARREDASRQRRATPSFDCAGCGRRILGFARCGCGGLRPEFRGIERVICETPGPCAYSKRPTDVRLPNGDYLWAPYFLDLYRDGSIDEEFRYTERYFQMKNYDRYFPGEA